MESRAKGQPSITPYVSVKWYNSSSVTLTLSSRDDLGLKGMHWQIDNSPEQVIVATGNSATSTFSVSTDGNHTIKYWSVGSDGFVEGAKTVYLPIDGTPPAIYMNVTRAHPGFVPAVVVVSKTSGVQSVVVAMLDGKTYSVGSPINSTGDHTLVVTAVNFAGTGTTKTTSFTVETSGALPSIPGGFVTLAVLAAIVLALLGAIVLRRRRRT